MKMDDCGIYSAALSLVVAPDVWQIRPEKDDFARLDLAELIANQTLSLPLFDVTELQFWMEVPRTAGVAFIDVDDTNRFVDSL